MVFGGWDVAIPRGTMDHRGPREHPFITRIWGENSLKHVGEHQNLVSFPHLCSLSPAQGYRTGFSVSGFHLNMCLLAYSYGFGCSEVLLLTAPSHEKPPATLLWSLSHDPFFFYDLLWAVVLSASA